MIGRKTLLVTGASAGAGRALTERAVRAGYAVFGVGRRTALLDELAASLRDAAGEFAALTLELQTPNAAQTIVAAALARFGRIDVLVNNAGAVATGSISEQSDAALREQFTVHVETPLALLREALPALRATHGHVFFIGSGVARVPVAGLGAYPSAKAAIRSAARIARNELRREGIAVTYVDPGAIATEFMTRAGMQGSAPALSVSPHEVARKILRAVGTRAQTVDAVPWQTALIGVSELLPRLTDAVLARAPGLVGAQRSAPTGSAATVEATAPRPRPETAAPDVPTRFDTPADVPVQSDSAADVPAKSDSVADAPVKSEGSPAETNDSVTPVREANTGEGSTGSLIAHSEFETALLPLESRMRRLNLRREFVISLLVPGTYLETSDVALRWAGMPNKNERAITHDVLEALRSAGFLASEEPGRYRVL